MAPYETNHQRLMIEISVYEQIRYTQGFGAQTERRGEPSVGVIHRLSLAPGTARTSAMSSSPPTKPTAGRQLAAAAARG
jgi:hypothetical protein